jgi:hypothetical protein
VLGARKTLANDRPKSQAGGTMFPLFARTAPGAAALYRGLPMGLRRRFFDRIFRRREATPEQKRLKQVLQPVHRRRR